MKIEVWEIKLTARLYYKETEMCENHNELIDRLDTLVPLDIQMSDEPAPPKPFGEAVSDSWRDVKGWYNGPEASQKTDPSVREHVNAELDRQIDKHGKQKPFPGILP